MSVKWKTKNGSSIHIKDMGDEHLINAMKLLIRHAVHEKVTTERCYLFPPFGGPSGDGAQMAFDSEFDQIMEMTTDDYLPDIYLDMQMEATRRKLQLPEMPDELAVSVLALKR